MEVSVIIPAYNEEKNIGSLLSTLCGMDGIMEILVVNDGSLDNTSEVARSFGVRVIDLKENGGKSHAMRTGIIHTAGEAVLFLDADLVGLTHSQVWSLILPIQQGKADMTLGLFNSGRGVTDLAQKLAPFLTGQRGVRRDVLERLTEEDWISGYGIEIALTRFAKDHDLRVLEIPLENVTHTMKEEKMGLAKGMKARLKMYWEIAKEINRI